jgi:hypothetical protein
LIETNMGRKAESKTLSLRERVAEGRVRACCGTEKEPSSVGCAATFSRREKA